MELIEMYKSGLKIGCRRESRDAHIQIGEMY